MEDVLSQILTELNSLKESVGRIEEGLKRMNCSRQATVGVSRHCEEEYGVENEVVYASTLENLDYIWRKVLDTICSGQYFAIFGFLEFIQLYASCGTEVKQCLDPILAKV